MKICTPPVSAPLSPSGKGCSGTCKAEACTTQTRVWVVAACEGMICLFQKTPEGRLEPISPSLQGVFPSIDMFQKFMDDAGRRHAFSQLVVIGGLGDIAWVHHALPASARDYTAAEIQYPLMASWFRETGSLQQLSQAIEHLFRV